MIEITKGELMLYAHDVHENYYCKGLLNYKLFDGFNLSFSELVNQLEYYCLFSKSKEHILTDWEYSVCILQISRDENISLEPSIISWRRNNSIENILF